MIQALVIVLFALFDANEIKKERYIYDHTGRFIIRVVTTVLISLFFDLTFFVKFCLLWVVLFDPTINIFLGRKVNSLGNTAKWDIFWKGKENVLLTIRILLLIIIFTI